MALNSKTIVHIADDEKFIDAAYDTYEKAFPGENLFIIVLKDESHEIRHLSKSKPYEFIYTTSDYIKQIQDVVSNSKMLVIHGFYGRNAKVAAQLNTKKTTTVGSIFGFEVYSNPYLFDEGVYDQKTYSKFVYKKKSLINKLKELIKKYHKRIIKGKKDKWLVLLKAIKKMDYWAGFSIEEYQLHKELSILKKRAKPLIFTYYPIGVVIKDNQSFVNDTNILLGNSAAITNNHLGALDVLKKMNLKNKKVITPLSYGKEKYAEEITKIGFKELGRNFEPLAEFLPLDEYQKILHSCGIMVMNHYRQQAAGNLFTALYMGAKVYLSKKNILYGYFKRIGCFVYCIEEDLLPENTEALQLLSPEQMTHNREILKKEISLERIVGELRKTLGPIIES